MSAAKLNVLSLFSGIGGLELGLERAGMTTVGQVELDPYCQQVLARHWPKVARHDDVRTVPEWWASKRRPRVDVVCGGFPCQPFSSGGLRTGVADQRWGWPWMADVVRAVRPRYVVVENVSDLIADADAFSWLLGDLADMGFDAEWGVFRASDFGLRHRRKRLILVAHSAGADESREGASPTEATGGSELGRSGLLPHWRNGWVPESALGRVAHGLPNWMVSPALHALGNAVVPQLSEHIGRLIVADDAASRIEVAA